MSLQSSANEDVIGKLKCFLKNLLHFGPLLYTAKVKKLTTYLKFDILSRGTVPWVTVTRTIYTFHLQSF